MPKFARANDAVFTRIRHLNKVTELEFNVDLDHFKLTSEEAIHPHFREALLDLGADVANILELDKAPNWEEQNPIAVYQVTIGRKGDARSFVFSAKRSLQKLNTTMTLNTPALWDGNIDQKLCLYERTVERLNRLEEEARLFLAGKAQQGELFESTQLVRTGPAIEEEEPVEDLADVDREFQYHYGDDAPPAQDASERLTYYEDVITDLEQSQPDDVGERAALLLNAFRHWRDNYSPVMDGKQFSRCHRISQRLVALKKESEPDFAGDGVATDVPEVT